ncbi:hypothetical protein Tco_0394767 [Tanacetum coccineum]
MVAYLEKTNGNAEFHEIRLPYMQLNSLCSHFAGKPVSISKASIRSYLQFNDAARIDVLPNQTIFDTIQLMGNQLKDVPVPLDHFLVPTLTKKVLTFMVKKGKNFSGKVTPLFDSMLVQQTEDEEGSGGNHGGQSSNDASLSGNEDGLTLQSVFDLYVSLCKQVTAQAKEIKDLKAQVKKLKKGVKPLITHHKTWMKTRLARNTSLKKKGVHKEYVSKQGRKSVKNFKGEPFVHKDLAFDDLDDFVDADDTLDYMETEDVQDERRNEGTNKGNEGTDKQDGGTDSTKVSTDRQGISLWDDETIAQVLIIMSQNKEKLKEKEKGVEIRNVEETERPRPTSTRSILTLRPLPKIDPKDKDKKRIKEEDESDTESEGITEAKKKLKQLANDEEVARKVQKEWEAEEEKKMLAEEEATKAALSNEYDFIQARLNADKILAEKLQEEERERDIKEARSELCCYLERSAEDERQIKEMNEESKDPEKKRLKKRVVNEEDTTKIVTFEGTLDSEIMEKKSVIARLDKVSSPDGDYLVLYRANGNFRAFNYLMEVLHIFDRQDLFHLYELMMEQYSEITLEGFELILWGDLKIMMESSTKENDQSDFWSNQQDWKIITWRLYEACGVCILELEDGIVIHMLVERRYPLSKELLQRMLDLGLEVERESIVALDLIRFIKQQIDEE